MQLSVQAANALKPLRNGELVQSAKDNLKIWQRPEEDLKQSLRAAMIMVGIRAKNMPDEEEKLLLLSFINKHFGNHTPEEVLLAFEMAVSGKLELGESGANCYENFSCEYVGRILTAYRKWASRQLELLPSNPPPGLTASKPDWTEMCEYHYTKFLTGKYNMSLWPWEMYGHYVEKGQLQENDYVLYVDEAKLLLREKTVEAAKEKSLIVDITSVLAKFYETLTDAQIEQWAKRIAVVQLFTRLNK